MRKNSKGFGSFLSMNFIFKSNNAYIKVCVLIITLIWAFFRVWSPVKWVLVPVKGNVNDTAYNVILDNVMLLALWQWFGEGHFLCQHDNVPVHKERSIKDMF